MYLAITKALSEDIVSGKLPSGYRLPPQRELAHKIGVALGTVTKAYIEAEKRGLIRSEGRRGTFIGGSGRPKSSLSQLINTNARAVDFGHNHPNYGDNPDLSLALKRAARDPNVRQLLHYPPSAGMPRHREAGARWLSWLGIEVDPDSVMITAGAQHALSIILAAIAERNDIILTDTYTYPGMKAVAGLLGLQLMGIQMDNGGILPDLIDDICNHRNIRAIYLNPTWQNPTGIIYSEKRRQEIAELAERHDFIIIEDEILRPLMESPPPFISSYAPQRSFVVMSSSKTIAAGLRTGFISVPVKYRQRVIDSLQTSLLSIAPLPVEILCGWINDGTAEKTILRRRTEIVRRSKMAKTILETYSISPLPVCQHLWLHLPDTWTGNSFTIEASRRDVIVTPAELFAVDSKAPMNAVRICLANETSRQTVRQGLEIIASILEGTPLQDSATV